MNRDQAVLWASAVAMFAAGDYATTRWGLEQGAVEAHPLSAAVIESGGLEASMAVGKGAVLAVAFAGYLYAAKHPETREHAEMFPLFLVLIGMGIVSHNLQIIEQTQV